MGVRVNFKPCRRFTRLINAFSKKVENHAHSVALFAMYYNFVRIHKTLRTTPAIAANVTTRLWEVGDTVDVLEAWETILAVRSRKAPSMCDYSLHHVASRPPKIEDKLIVTKFNGSSPAVSPRSASLS
jgi:hypothetical protein